MSPRRALLKLLFLPPASPGEKIPTRISTCCRCNRLHRAADSSVCCSIQSFRYFWTPPSQAKAYVRKFYTTRDKRQGEIRSALPRREPRFSFSFAPAALAEGCINCTLARWMKIMNALVDRMVMMIDCRFWCSFSDHPTAVPVLVHTAIRVLLLCVPFYVLVPVQSVSLFIRIDTYSYMHTGTW